VLHGELTAEKKWLDSIEKNKKKKQFEDRQTESIVDNNDS